MITGHFLAHEIKYYFDLVLYKQDFIQLKVLTEVIWLIFGGLNNLLTATQPQL